jgi:transcriptional regulator with XRE-family HTH domain
MTGACIRQILGKNIKLLRNLRSLSQNELAEKANISIPFLSNIERSNKWPYPDTLAKLAEALGVEVYELFKETKPSLSDNEKLPFVQFKKDRTVSLHKSVSASIDSAIETISSHYINDCLEDK